MIMLGVIGHALTEEFKKTLTKIKLEALPPNTTSVLQPCDAGIIAAFKAKYRAKVVRHLLKLLDEDNTIDEKKLTIDVKQAIYFERRGKKYHRKQFQTVGKRQKSLTPLIYQNVLKN